MTKKGSHKRDSRQRDRQRTKENGFAGAGKRLRAGQVVEHVVERIAEVPKIIQQRRTQHRSVEQVVDVPVPQITEEIIHVPTVVRQQHHREVEVHPDVQVPMQQEEIVPQKRFLQQLVESSTEVLVATVEEGIARVPRVIQQPREPLREPVPVGGRPDGERRASRIRKRAFLALADTLVMDFRNSGAMGTIWGQLCQESKDLLLALCEEKGLARGTFMF